MSILKITVTTLRCVSVIVYVSILTGGGDARGGEH